MFIDRVVVEVRSGKGGDGAIAFLRDKNTAKGGPSGGNGGKGGSIFFHASSKINTLINYRFSKVIQAKDGEKGQNKNKYGKCAPDVICDVPIGTIIIDEKTKEILADLKNDGDIFMVAKGGRGGRGNLCFKSPYNKTPKIAENGHPGITKRVVLELKLLADVGLVGLPSVGKSTFLSVVTRANPLIGNYDFTTISPNLGVCYVDEYRSFVIADLPGLIEGASKGKGLGFTFLRHIERCRVICHVISMDGRYDPVDAFKIIEEELKSYNSDLDKKKRMILATKTDVDGSKENLKKLEKYINGKIDIIPISSVLHKNLNTAINKLYELVELQKTEEINNPDIQNSSFKKYEYKAKSDDVFSIIKVSNNHYKIVGESVEKTYKLMNISTDEGMMRLIKYLNYIGVDDKLEELGAKDGDLVTLCDFEFEYFN